MNIYTVTEVMKILHVGRDRAYEIMKQRGFRLGYTPTSPVRISQKQLEDFINERSNQETGR